MEHSAEGICTLAPDRPRADVGICRACIDQGLFDALEAPEAPAALEYEGHVKFADGSILSLQCFEGRHTACPSCHAPGGDEYGNGRDILDGYCCECDWGECDWEDSDDPVKDDPAANYQDGPCGDH